MKTSDEGLKFIAKEEGGFVDHVYVDFAGVKTIGFGHALKSGEKFDTITEEQGLELLRKDVAVAESNVTKRVKVALTQNEFDALVSFTFNLGGGALASSTLLQLLNEGNYKGAAEEFLKWCKYRKYRDTGALKTSEGLLNRRKRERKVFMTP